MQAGRARKGRLELTDLDDGCLSRIFAYLTPLPDLFNIARVCQVSDPPFLQLDVCSPIVRVRPTSLSQPNGRTRALFPCFVVLQPECTARYLPVD